MVWPRRAWLASWVVLGAACAASTDAVHERDAQWLSELQEENAELRDRVERLERTGGHGRGLLVPYRFGDSEIHALVTEVSSPLRRVVLDQGKRSSIEAGHVFIVYRDSRYAGRVQVTEVDEEACSAMIVDLEAPIATGDHALLECRCKHFVPLAWDLVPPPIDASILEMEPSSKLVVLDKGKEDFVEIGYVFDVYRGSTYKGRVKVTEVQERTCTCEILSEKNPIVAGDSATTTL